MWAPKGKGQQRTAKRRLKTWREAEMVAKKLLGGDQLIVSFSLRRDGILSPTDHQTDSLPKQNERLTDEKTD